MHQTETASQRTRSATNLQMSKVLSASACAEREDFTSVRCVWVCCCFIGLWSLNLLLRKKPRKEQERSSILCPLQTRMNVTSTGSVLRRAPTCGAVTTARAYPTTCAPTTTTDLSCALPMVCILFLNGLLFANFFIYDLVPPLNPLCAESVVPPTETAKAHFSR